MIGAIARQETFQVFAAVLWFLMALYGCVVQTINMRWALYKRKVVHSRPVPRTDELIAVQGHIRVNAARSFVVVVNLVVGILAVFYPQTSPLTPEGAVFAVGFLANEIIWDAVVTIEIVERWKLRGARG